MTTLFAKAREPLSSLTHFIGGCFAILATLGLWLAWQLGSRHDIRDLAGGLVFGVSMVALYSASSIYHGVQAPPKVLKRLRKFDHSMIFVLIAGTYTPLCLHYMTFEQARLFLTVFWIAALAGVVMKLVWLDAPRWLSTVLYVAMGWSILIDWRAFASIPAGGIALVAAGGISYTVGALIYIVKKPDLRRIGFHELFHLFVLGGTLFHFFAVLFYVVL